jgi:hypothetical protein
MIEERLDKSGNDDLGCSLNLLKCVVSACRCMNQIIGKFVPFRYFFIYITNLALFAFGILR